jgi:hypothetical protein
MKIWRMRIACWLTKATHTQNMLYLLLFYCNNDCTNSPQCYLYVHCLSFCKIGRVGLCPIKYCKHLASTSLIHVLRTIIWTARYIFISYFYDDKILFLSYKDVIILPFKLYNAFKTHGKVAKESQWNIANINFHYQFWRGGGGRKIAENLILGLE